MATTLLFPELKDSPDEEGGYLWVGETISNPTYDSRYDPFSLDYLGNSDPEFKYPTSNDYAGFKFLPKNLNIARPGYQEAYMGDVNDVKFQGTGQGVDSLISSKDWNRDPSMDVDQDKVQSAFDQWKYAIDVNTVNYKISFAYTSGTNLPGHVSGATYVGANDKNFNEAADWTQANVPLAFGLLATQLIDAAKYYLEIKAQNPGLTITLTGHSLGGGLAA